MRVTSILSEAWRNVITGTARVPLFAALIALSAGLAASADITTVHTIHNNARSYIDAGGATQYILAENGVNTTACESLATYSAVNASGSLRQTADITIDSLPGSSFQTYEVSTGFARILGIPSNGTGVWVSHEFAQTLGATTGTTLTSEGETLQITGIFDYPDDGRDSRLGYAFIVPVPEDTGAFNECWMKTWPQLDDTDALLHSTLSAQSDGTDVAISQLNKSVGAHFDGPAQFAERLTRWSPLAAAMAGALLGLAWTRRRRLEHAASLHAGQTRTAMTTTALLETLAWAILGTALTGAITTIGVMTLIPEDMGWAIPWPFHHCLPPSVAPCSEHSSEPSSSRKPICSDTSRSDESCFSAEAQGATRATVDARAGSVACRRSVLRRLIDIKQEDEDWAF
ncbi:hypothetical protein [Ruania rhizosphaerae]|uniref:hypothetical protein n=1 Tax=Ruania rhizosphaerae TaxID=1840413 RepID=UPI0013572509|nr:hypothetical protein [Ruania rhizosphaerae]